MAIGAFTVALLTAKAGWPALPATLVAVAAAAAGGVLAGAGVVRLRPVFIAVTTWILTWAVAIFLLAFRSVSGGAQGLVLPSSISVTAHYELGLALLAVAVLVAASLARGGPGIELRAARQVPAGGGGARRRHGTSPSRRVRRLGRDRRSRRRSRRAARGCRGRERVRAVPLVQALRRGAARRRRLGARAVRRHRRPRRRHRRRRCARLARRSRVGALRPDARGAAPPRRARARRRGDRPAACAGSSSATGRRRRGGHRRSSPRPPSGARAPGRRSSSPSR